jgi:hypothetical protein
LKKDFLRITNWEGFAITARGFFCSRDQHVSEELQEENGILYEYQVYERLHSM